MFEPVLTPAGHLVFRESEQGAGAALTEAVAKRIHKAFDKNPSEGLLDLATALHDISLPPTLHFWRDFSRRYLNELCQSPAGDPEPLAPPREELEALARGAPLMRGGEYLNADTLERLWTSLDEYARAEIAASPGGLSAWLKKRSPLWHRVGRVCFHLAENKRDPLYPFAFMATYAPKLEGRRVQYQPLGKALEQYAGAKNRKALVHLLTPVQRAAERCAWVKALVDSRDVFHPIAWTPDEAWNFLNNIPELEESGLLVRVPDWWKKRPSRVQVSVSIGQRKSSVFSAEAMLDFKVDLALDGETLSQKELREILKGADGLVFLKGRWVEVDREKLTGALEHWKRVEEEASDGISFIQGMRMLAGAPIDSDLAGLFDKETADWSEVRAGEWLQERLRELRRPETLKAASLDSDLKTTLRPYQKVGLQWLHFLSKLGLGACLADDMGLGKTIQVLALLLLMKRERKKKKIAPALLVLPASLLANWKAEMERFTPSLAARFVHPSLANPEELKKASRNPESFVNGADAVLTTYGMLLRQEWLTRINWSLVVLDEAQAIKNPAARQTRATKKLKADARIALTGTPVENRLSDLWSIFDFLCPGLLGSAKAFGNFIKRLEDREQNQYAPLRNLVRPYILRRLKTDKAVITDLPDKTEVQAYCTLTKMQAALYEQSVQELAQALDGTGGIERRGVVLSFILRFKQICNHPAQWLGSGDYEASSSGKFSRLREICEEIASRQEKALVFTQFREMTAPLADYMGEIFGRPGAVLHGGTPVAKRKKLVDEFQREEGPPFFVLSIKAGGTGLNLTAASHVIHFDRWWNPAVENQATDRAFRIGQKHNVLVHKFICLGTIEEKIDALIREKTGLAEELLAGGAQAIVTEMDDRQLLELVKLDVNRIGG